MEDGQVGLGAFQLAGGEDIGVLQANIVGLVEEPLPLHPGHVQDIQMGHGLLQAGHFPVGRAAVLEHGGDIARRPQFLRGDEHELHVLIPGHGVEQGMHRAAELKVPAHAHGQAAQPALFPADGEQVGEGLGGVAVAAVPGVDEGHGQLAGGGHGRALLGVAHGNDVGVTGHGAHRVGNALPLGGGAGLGFGEAQHAAAQLQHGRLEAQAGAGAGLKEQGSQFLALHHVGVLGAVGDDVVRQIQNPVDLVNGQVGNVDEVTHIVLLTCRTLVCRLF